MTKTLSIGGREFGPFMVVAVAEPIEPRDDEESRGEVLGQLDRNRVETGESELFARWLNEQWQRFLADPGHLWCSHVWHAAQEDRPVTGAWIAEHEVIACWPCWEQIALVYAPGDGSCLSCGDPADSVFHLAGMQVLAVVRLCRVCATALT